MEEKKVLSEADEELVAAGAGETLQISAGLKCPHCGSSNIFVSRKSLSGGKMITGTCRDCKCSWSLPAHS